MNKHIRKMKKTLNILIGILIILIFAAWGWQGHRKISRNATLSFPASLNFLLFMNWDDSLSAHASDADYRKSWDPEEGPKHYIDIDAYPEFIANGVINQNYNSLIAIHGSTFVNNYGILPWATITCFDSLTSCFARNDWPKALFFASDLGHYVADGHMPLHLTLNYDGQLSGQTGIHSRYESDLISAYNNQIVYQGSTVQYVSNVSDFIFNYIYTNNQLVDSILNADSIAYAQAGNYQSSQYRQKMWNKLGNMTIQLFSDASLAIASLIYTAWINAGSPTVIAEYYQNNIKKINLTSFNIIENTLQFNYYLDNLSNSFNYNIVDTSGKVIFISEQEDKQAGHHNQTVNLSGISKGYYILNLYSGQYSFSQNFYYGK